MKWSPVIGWCARTRDDILLTWFMAGGAIRIAHYDVIDDVITRKLRDRVKRRPHRPMKSSELSNGENRIALRQLLQNRKLRHWWRHNLGSKCKLQKMARENFSIRALYNITKNQHNPITTVGRDSFLSPKPLKIQVFKGSPSLQGSHSPYILGDTTRSGHVTCFIVWSKSDRRRLKKTAKQTNRHYENNGHLAMNQHLLYGRRASSVADLTVWNSPPDFIRGPGD